MFLTRNRPELRQLPTDRFWWHLARGCAVKRPEQHQTDSEGRALLLQTFAALGWTVNPITEDYGRDFDVEIFHSRQSTGKIFSVQLKSSIAPAYSATTEFISQELESNSAQYLALEMHQPVLLITADVTVHRIFWAAPQMDFAFIKDLSERPDAKTFTLRVPVMNELPATEDLLLGTLGEVEALLASRFRIGAPTIASPEAGQAQLAPLASSRNPREKSDLPDLKLADELSGTSDLEGPRPSAPFIQPDLIFGGTTTSLIQAISHNDGLIRSSGGLIPGADFQVRITEASASSFKPRKRALTPDGKTVPAPTVDPVDNGTRIRIRFNNIGAGVSIFVPVAVDLVIPGTSTPTTGRLILIATDPTGNAAPGFVPVTGTTGPESSLAAVSYSRNAGYATYEVVRSNPNVVQRANVNVFVAFIANTGQDLPALGQTTVSTGFAPGSNVTVDESPPRNAFAINPITSDLLFPFVTNQDGFDTRIAIANTSLDPFGTSAQKGRVTLFYYGTVNGVPSPQATQVTDERVPAGSQLVFSLSEGGNFGIKPTPGFQGYIVAVTDFQYSHALAFISDRDADSQSYLAIHLNRGGQPFED